MGPPSQVHDLCNVSTGKFQSASHTQHSKFIFPTILLLFQCWRLVNCLVDDSSMPAMLVWMLCLFVHRRAHRQQHTACLEKELDKSVLSHLWPRPLFSILSPLHISECVRSSSSSLPSCESPLAHCHPPRPLQWLSSYAQKCRLLPPLPLQPLPVILGLPSFAPRPHT